MPGRKIFRATVLACAEDAIKHARRKILHGSTQLENNDLSPAMFEELNDGVETLRTEIDRTVSKWLEAHPLDDPFFIRFRVTVDLSSKFALGSCHELAVQALDYILEHDPDINAEIFSIKHGDHEILVLNRDPRSDPRRPETWGPNAVICDPWADDFYEAYKYRSRLRAYEYDEANKLNHSVKLGPRHELSATRTFNSNYFLREDTVGDLKDRFSVQAQSMIRALEDFRAELVGEQERLKDKPKKEAIISNKIREVEDTIQLLTERHLDSIEDDYPDFETAKSDLLVDLDLIRQGVGVMQFSQEEQGILHEHSNLLKRTGLLGGITDTESNLQRITEEASERFKANPLA